MTTSLERRITCSAEHSLYCLTVKIYYILVKPVCQPLFNTWVEPGNQTLSPCFTDTCAITTLGTTSKLADVVGFEPTKTWSQSPVYFQSYVTPIVLGPDSWLRSKPSCSSGTRFHQVSLIGINLVALTRIELVINAYQASVIPFNYRAV